MRRLALLVRISIFTLMLGSCGVSTPRNQASLAGETITPSVVVSQQAETSIPTAEANEGTASNAQSAKIDVYDPKRDPQADLQHAIAVAQETNQHILLEVGGDWCVWCHKMDVFYEKHPELLTLREKNYILVKVNFSDANENKTFLAHYPDVAGYPHIFVLDRDGKLLHSEDTAKLEQGDSYHLERFTTFLKKWGPDSHR